MADTPAENFFRVVDGKYLHNNEEVSKEEFDRRKADVDTRIQELRTAPTKGAEDLEDFAAEAKARMDARRKAAGKKAGGAIRSASSRADGIAQRGKTRGKMVMCGGGMAKGKR
jgi:hypothetical protein